MSWLALTMVAFVIFVLVFFVKNRQLNHPALQYPYRLKASLFSPAERELLEMLQRTVGERYLIFPKVSVADVVGSHRHRSTGVLVPRHQPHRGHALRFRAVRQGRSAAGLRHEPARP